MRPKTMRRMGRLSTRMTSMTAMVLTARTVYSCAALLAAFSPSRRPRYWLLMTAPPVARADRIWMIKIFRLSTRLTLDTAASPTPDTIRVSAMPMDTDKNCSASSGKISRTNAWRLKIGSDRVDSALFVLLIRSRYSLFALRRIYMFIIIRREKQKSNICAN